MIQTNQKYMNCTEVLPEEYDAFTVYADCVSVHYLHDPS